MFVYLKKWQNISNFWQKRTFKGHQSNFERILSFKNLKSLHVNTDGSLCGLVDMLHSLEKMKNLDLSFNISTDEKMRNVEEIDFLFKKKTEAF